MKSEIVNEIIATKREKARISKAVTVMFVAPY
jgi:hypothetical protein